MTEGKDWLTEKIIMNIKRMEKMGQNLKNRELCAKILRRESYWPHIKNTENELKIRDYRSL